MTDRWTPPPDSSMEDEAGHVDAARDSERLLRALRVAVPVEAAEKVAARRRVLIQAIGKEIERVPTRIARQELRRRWIVGGLAAIALVSVGLAGASLFGIGAPTAQRDGAPRPALQSRDDGRREDARQTPADGLAMVTLTTRAGSRDDVFSVGQELSVHRGEHVSARLPGSTELRFEADASIGRLQLSQLGRLDQSLFVKSGALSVDVPTDGTERRSFTVITPHARVEVKGTQFRVLVSEGVDAHTAVSVERGSVAVSWLGGHTLLTRGQTWDSKDLEHPEPDRSSAVPDRYRAVPDRSHTVPTHGVAAHSSDSTNERLHPRVRVQSTSSEETAVVSTLAQQNALIERAMSAEKLGQLSRAAALYDKLITEFPESPLRATALSERRRVLERMGNL